MVLELNARRFEEKIVIVGKLMGNSECLYPLSRPEIVARDSWANELFVESDDQFIDLQSLSSWLCSLSALCYHSNEWKM